MDIALAKMEHLHSQAQAMMAQSRASPTLSHSSPEPPTTPIMARGPSLSAVHGAMLSHGHDILSKLHKVSYSSPPPIACSPENNVCKLINYRGAKVAAFCVDGRELICLPQAFELFLKHLVGGLHTVYTKLKRLDVTPVVCNVEQVRVLRGLGAIQPGVNRCKLISCKEFDVLYDDCTNSSARPGRPPKRSPSLHASPETIDKLKKSRFDGTDYYNSRFFETTKNMFNGFPPHPYTMGHLPFMQLNHPLLAPPVTLAMAQQLGLRHEGLLSRDSHSTDPDRITESDDNKDRCSPKHPDNHFHPAYHTKSNTTHAHSNPHKDHENNTPLNLHINGHAEDLRKSPTVRSEISDENEDIDDDNPSDDDKSLADSADLMETLSQVDEREVITPHSPAIPASLTNGSLPGYSSIETLLMNIQGLLKVAGENARHQERQINELKNELSQEKKAREDLERKLQDEQKIKNMLHRRLKKERRARKRMEDTSQEANENRPSLGQKFESSSPNPIGNGETKIPTNNGPQNDDGHDRYSSSRSPSDNDRQDRQSVFPQS